jgi:hypothetical protein
VKTMPQMKWRATSEPALSSFLRGGLITARQFEVAVEFAVAKARKKIPQMQRDEAVDLLLRGVSKLPGEVVPFRALATRLGDWPLMLKLARGALEQRLARGDSLSGALSYLNLALDRRGFTVFDSGVCRPQTAGAAVEQRRKRRIDGNRFPRAPATVTPSFGRGPA